MNYCPHCNNPLAEGAQFCVYCGESVAPPTPKPTFCYKCGKPLEAGALFCVYCGANLDIIPQAQPAVPEPPPVIPEPQTSLQPVEEIPVCPYCGTAYESDSLFCFHCGARREDLSAPQATLAAEPIPATVAEEKPPEHSPILPTDYRPKKKKNGLLIFGIVAAMLALVVGMFLLGGPGIPMGQMFADADISPSTTPPDPVEVHLTVAVNEGEERWIEERIIAFEAAHPEYVITLEILYINPNDAANIVTSDPVAAPDVYMYSSDQVNKLVDAGALAPLEGEYLDFVQSNMGKSMVDSATGIDGSVYGFPYNINSWYMYYDKSVYSEQDIRSLEAMLEKGGVSFPVNNSWYLGAFYAAGGATFFGEHGIDADAGIRLTGGDAVTAYLCDLMNHPNFYAETDPQYTINQMATGQVSACFSGAWMRNQYYEIWGENMGVAVVPAIQLNGRTCQLQPFANTHAIGVNPYAENLDAAFVFAAFLASEESQLARFMYATDSIFPTHLALLDNDTIQSDPVAVALLETTASASIAQPNIPEMAYYWDAMTRLGNRLISGQVTSRNASEVIAETEAAMNGG